MSEPYWVALGPKATPVDYVGDWAAGTPYLPGQVVRRNGADHIAVNPSTGQEPSGQVGALPVIGMGTSLPASPYDGQEYILTDSLTAPTYVWRLRYVAAAASNKWWFLGGMPKDLSGYPNAIFNTLTQVGATGYRRHTSTDFIVPVAGAYYIETAIRITVNGAAGFCDMSAFKNAAMANDRHGAQQTWSVTTGDISVHGVAAVSGCVAGDTIGPCYLPSVVATHKANTQSVMYWPKALGG